MYLSFTEMPVWELAFNLSDKVFILSSKSPRSEDYGLASQIRRSANSVSASIAEGFGRSGNKDKCHFYIMSRGSAYETQHHLTYGVKVGYFNNEIVHQLFKRYSELIYDLNKIIKSLK